MKSTPLNLDDLQVSNNLADEVVSSQKKNIFYMAFKNIKERYQFKEQRSNKIKMRSEEIIKDFRLPSIHSGKHKKNESKKFNTQFTNKPFMNTKFS